MKKQLTFLLTLMISLMLVTSPALADPVAIGVGVGNADAAANLIYAPTSTSINTEFAPGHMQGIAPLSYYTGSETPGYTYATMKELLAWGKVFTESQLRSMAGDRGIRNAVVDVTMMDSNMARQKPTLHPIAKERTITVVIAEPIAKPIRKGAYITIAMKSVKGVSVECLGKAGVAALEVGANTLYFTAEGLDITQSQHSFAAGPGISVSTIGGTNNRGVTGGGGLVYTYGVFGKNYKPFQRFMALYVEDEEHKYALKGEKVQK